MQDFLSHLKTQLAYYKKQTAMLLILLLVWAGLMGKYFFKRGPARSRADTPPTASKITPSQHPTSHDTDPDSEPEERPQILALWEDLHRDLDRNPFESPLAVQITEADEDGDNVPNIVDQCPGSRPGVEVDSQGCAVQSPGASTNCGTFLAHLQLMGTIKPEDASLPAGAIINDIPYKTGDVMRKFGLQVIEIIDQDRVLLKDLSTGRECILTTTTNVDDVGFENGVKLQE